MKNIIALILICTVSKTFGNKISEGYQALSIFDYFKAKELFYKSLSKNPAQSSFGLAIIYYRNDNPFSNIDSSAKYISICKSNFKDTVTHSLYHINRQTINELAINIGSKGYAKYGNQNSVEMFNYFLSNFYFSDSTLLTQTYLKRDALQLSRALATQSSDSVAQFLLKYPQSYLYQKAKKLFFDYQFTESTQDKSVQQYQLFIKNFPTNPNIALAETNLFNLIQPLHSSDSIYNFIKKYSTTLTKETAWKLLYSTSVKSYNKDELTNFLTKYPEYPFNETILKEISLTQNILIPLKDLNDNYGFIDTLGNWKITPQFDDASAFSEGFASVCKNDSCFYINKEGNKIFDYYFEETEDYKNGIAIVKKENIYFLINRSGQLISKGYQDINEVSEKLFVCKSNNLYGAINLKGEIIIPFIYTKLGNFKNNYAYYLSAQYGLVDITNKALQAQWEWISDVDSNSIAVVKKNSKFGLITINESIILPTEYDYITHCQNEIYLIVKNNLYGFYNIKEKCFVTSVDNDYNSSFEPNYYSNGKYFKLIKDDEVALVDANGRYSINFGTYSNLFFAKCDIIRIQKNNKYGYVDRKLKPVTKVEYDKASDYINDIAITSKENTTYLIDKTGKPIYTLKNGEIEIIENSLLKVKLNELVGLLNKDGKPLLNPEFESITLLYNQLYACIKNNDLYLFNLRTKSLKKI
jgi:hypothetical protein